MRSSPPLQSPRVTLLSFPNVGHLSLTASQRPRYIPWTTTRPCRQDARSPGQISRGSNEGRQENCRGPEARELQHYPGSFTSLPSSPAFKMFLKLANRLRITEDSPTRASIMSTFTLSTNLTRFRASLSHGRRINPPRKFRKSVPGCTKIGRAKSCVREWSR